MRLQPNWVVKVVQRAKGRHVEVIMPCLKGYKLRSATVLGADFNARGQSCDTQSHTQIQRVPNRIPKRQPPGKAPIEDDVEMSMAAAMALAAAADSGEAGQRAGAGGGQTACQRRQEQLRGRQWRPAFHPAFTLTGTQPQLLLPQVNWALGSREGLLESGGEGVGSRPGVFAGEGVVRGQGNGGVGSREGRGLQASRARAGWPACPSSGASCCGDERQLLGWCGGKDMQLPWGSCG